ncbi:sigma-70 family RNA polymerase sigma factor [Candidatus Poribacteria bacterium]
MQIDAETIWKTNRFQEEALPHMDSVYRCALYMTKNESDAKDLVQETYFRAYKFFSNFREGTDCKAWLITILRNTFINTIHRERKHPQMIYLSEINEHEIGLSGDADPEDTIFGNLFDDDVAAAMDSLPVKYRTAVLLADIEGFSYREIADRVNCPIGTVMSRLGRGRRLLKKRLQNYAVQRGFA